MGRFFIILAVIVALALPTAGAFASSVMLDCKCPASSHCSDHSCDSAKCHSATGFSFVVPAFSSDFLIEKEAALFMSQASFAPTFRTSSLFKPPRLI